MDALLNSRVERGHHIQGETKRSSTGTLCKVRLPAETKRAFSQQQSVKVHDETWAGGQKILRLSISQTQEIQPRCAVSIFSCVLLFSLPSYLGREVKLERGKSGPRWRKQKSGGFGASRVPLEPGNLSCSLRCTRLGEEGVVPHSVVGPIHFLVFVFIRVWTRHSYRATYWCAVLATAHQDVEGYRSPDEAVVC